MDAFDKPTVINNSIAGRAEQAFKEQQKKEEERVNALKQSHDAGTECLGSLKGKWGSVLEANKAGDSSKIENQQMSTPVSSIAGRAEQAFKEQQRHEEERLNALKQGHGTGAASDGSGRRGSLKGKWEGALEANKTPDSSNNSVGCSTPVSSIAGRAEQAFKEQQRHEEERLNALKQGHGTGAASDGSAGSGRRGSLKGKWEGALEANKTPDSSNNSVGCSTPVSSIAGRAEQAFKEQQRHEEERLNALKQGHGTGAASDGSAGSGRRGSLKGKWEGVLKNTQKAEQDKIDTKKGETKSQFKTTEGTGLVSQRIGQWEELIMMNVASKDSVAATTAAALALIHSRWEEAAAREIVAGADAGDIFSHSGAATVCVASDIVVGEQRKRRNKLFESADISIIPENIVAQYPEVELFYSGETKLYNAKSSSGYSHLLPFSKDYSSKPLPLPCGMSSSQDKVGNNCDCIASNTDESAAGEKKSEVGVDVVALAMNAGDGNTFLALTVIGHNSEAAQNNAFARERGLGISYVYGLKKVSVFDPSGIHILKDIFVYLVEKVAVAEDQQQNQQQDDVAAEDERQEKVVAEDQQQDQRQEKVVSEVQQQNQQQDDVAAEDERQEKVAVAEVQQQDQRQEKVVSEVQQQDQQQGDVISEDQQQDHQQGDVISEVRQQDQQQGEDEHATEEQDGPGEDNVNDSAVMKESVGEGAREKKEGEVEEPSAAARVGTASKFPAQSEADAASTDMQSSPNTPSKADEGEDTWRTQYTPPSQATFGRNDAVEDDDGDFSEDDDDSDLSSGGALVNTGFYSFGRSQSTAQAISQSKYLSPVTANDKASFVPTSPSLQNKNSASSSGAGKDILGGCGHWTREDEVPADQLPFGSETVVDVAIEDILSISCTSSALTMQCNNKHQKYSNVSKPVTRRLSWTGRKNAEEVGNAIGAGMLSDSVSVVVTGTLKHAIISTPSLFVLNEDKLFEYLRGAAMSGWMYKWPMKSQKYGRRTKRFFILRDANLSYHRKPPTTIKEYIYGCDNYAMSSLKVGKTTTVAKGYKRFWSCVVIQTDADTLWMKGADAETEDRWVEAVSTSVSNLNRSPVFLTKPTIECIWHHESNKNFKAIAMDAVSSVSASFSSIDYHNKYPNVLHYVHVALFSFEYHHGASGSGRNDATTTSASVGGSSSNKVYSIDLGGDELERKQLEIVPVGVGINSQYAEITSQLSCIKLLCASDNAPVDFVPRSSRTAADESASARNTNNVLMVIGGSAGFLTIATIGLRQMVANDVVDTSVLAQERHSASKSGGDISATEEEVVYCDMDISNHYHNLQQQQVATMAAISKAKRTPLQGSTSSAGASAADVGLFYSMNYHSIHSAIAAIATNPDRMMFISGDTHGGLGLWKIVPHEPQKKRTYNDSDINNFKYEAMSSQSRSRLTVTARLECFINVNKLANSVGDPSDPFANNGEYMEAVNNIQFLPNGSHIAVSTTRRFLLLGLTPVTKDGNGSPASNDKGHLKTFYTCGVLRYIHTHGLTMDSPSFLTWTVLDRSAPSVKSLFAICVENVDSPEIASTPEQRHSDEWPGGLTDSRITVWKVLGGEENVGTDGDNKKCTLYRFKWTAEMLNLAMQRSQPVVNDDGSNTLTFL